MSLRDHKVTQTSPHPWNTQASTFSLQWFPLTAPSGEDATGNWEEEGKEGYRGCSKEGWRRWRSGRDEGPPGIWLKCFLLPNLLLYFEKPQEGCLRCKEASDRWSDMKALTDLINGISTLAEWLHHHGKDREWTEKTKDSPLLGDNCINRMGFLPWSNIWIAVGTKCSVSSRLILCIMTSSTDMYNVYIQRHPDMRDRNWATIKACHSWPKSHNLW